MHSLRNYQTLFVSDTPMIDVRAPIEYAQGAFPNAHNLPLMVDKERSAVGTCYKIHGPEAAVKLGHELVNGATKAERVHAWRLFVERHPDAVLYCFRGGLRSRISQQWLQEAGISLPYVHGGYKALRSYLLDHLNQQFALQQFQVLSGRTGSGKTEVIRDWKFALDLEGYAKHRGSAFGGTGETQPSQIDFENHWAVAWLKHSHRSAAPVLIEDESRLIGRVAVPPSYLAAAAEAHNIVLESPLEQRIARIRHDYFEQAFFRYQQQGIDAFDALRDYIAQALQRIQKRLGGVRHQALIAQLDAAILKLRSQNQWSGFDEIVERLLQEYYDPMYDYQYQKKAARTLFKGSADDILNWLADHTQGQ